MNIISELDINVLIVVAGALLIAWMAFVHKNPDKIVEAVQKIENDARTMAKLEQGYNQADPNVKAIIELGEKMLYFLYHSTPVTGSVLSGYKEPLGAIAGWVEELSDEVPVATKTNQPVTAVIRDGTVKFEQAVETKTE